MARNAKSLTCMAMQPTILPSPAPCRTGTMSDPDPAPDYSDHIDLIRHMRDLHHCLTHVIEGGETIWPREKLEAYRTLVGDWATGLHSSAPLAFHEAYLDQEARLRQAGGERA